MKLDLMQGENMEVDMVSLGMRIRKIRKRKKLTLEQLSEMTDISTVLISQIENGTRTGRLDTLITISNALEVSIEDILVDSLLYTNAEGKSKHEDDLSYLLLDCNENESRFIIKNAENVKELLKKYLQK